MHNRRKQMAVAMTCLVQLGGAEANFEITKLDYSIN